MLIVVHPFRKALRAETLSLFHVGVPGLGMVAWGSSPALGVGVRSPRGVWERDYLGGVVQLGSSSPGGS